MRHGAGNMAKDVLSYLAVLVVVLVVVMASLYLVMRVRQTEVQTVTPASAPAITPGLWEGQGVLTLGCSLWQRVEEFPATSPLRPTDFFIKATNEGLIFGFVLPDGTALTISGARCGVSVDWTTLPKGGN